MLASQPWSIGLLDDQGSIEPCTSGDGKKDNGNSKWQSAMKELHLGGGSMLRNNSQQEAGGNNTVRLNRACIRRFVNVFMAFYRSMHLWEIKQSVDAGAGKDTDQGDCGIRIHHIVAASDDFNKLSMHWDLMPAAKLNYVHDFRGFFNCISQVIFFLSCL